MTHTSRGNGSGSLLLTGGTGFLGRHLLPLLAGWNRPILVLCRPGSEARFLEARARAEAAVPGSGARIEPLIGDLAVADLGLSEGTRARVVAAVDEVFHLGALTDAGAGREALIATNLEGTDHVLELARGIRHFQRFHFVSSFEVSGDHPHTFLEDQLFVNQRFVSDRALSKFRAEAAVRKNAAILPVTIYRPAALVGDSRTGEMPRLDGPYLLFEAIRRLRGISALLPFFGPGGDHFVQMVPVDYAAQALASIAGRERRRGANFALADPRPPTYFEFYGMVRERMGLPRPRFGLPVQPLRRALALPLAAVVLRQALRVAGIPPAVLDYVHPGALHDTSNTEALLRGSGISCPRVRDYFDRIFAYYVSHLAS
jgi:thioester reductase-like protein